MYDNREEIKAIPLIWQNLLRQFAMDIETAIPAVVLSYDRADNIVTCRPAINRVTVENESVERSEVVVPCLNLAGNGIGLNFPLKSGDTGWIIAADSDTENFKRTLAVSDPNTYEIHRYQHGFFIPDQVSGFEIAEEDSDALVIQTLDGKTKIAIGAGQISIASESNVKVNALTADVTAVTSATVICPAISVTGAITVNGTITATGDITAGSGTSNISLLTHKHLDPQEEYTMTGKPTA